MDKPASAVHLGVPDIVAGRRSRLMLTVALVLFATMFAYAATSWVGFMKWNGGPVGLFTQTDFPAVVIGARLVNEGQGDQLYNLDMQLREQQSLRAEGYLSLSAQEDAQLKYPYPYPPFLAVLWSLFTNSSPLGDMAIYDLINIAAMCAGLWLLLLALPLTTTARLLLLLAGLTCFPFIVNLEQGQSSGLMALGLGAGIALLRRGKELPAGLMLGLLVFKIQWLPLIVMVLLFKRRWGALGGLAATGLSFFLVTILTIGTGWIKGFVDLTLQAQHFSKSLLLAPQASHSLTGALGALLGPGNDALIATANEGALLVAAGLLLYAWRGPWQPGTARWDGLMALTVLATLLTNLQVNTHDLCLVVVPAALAISYVNSIGLANRTRLLVYGLFWAAYLVCWPPTLFTEPLRLTALVMICTFGVLLSLLSIAKAPTTSSAVSD